MAARKKNKKINYSTVEIDVLTSEVESNRKILFASANSGVTNAVKTTVWARITERVNSVSNVERTRREVKKKWSDLKLFTRKKESQLRRSQLLTGDGQTDPDPLFTAVEERIASIIGQESSDDPAEGLEVPGGEYVLLSEEAISGSAYVPPKEEPEEQASADVVPPKEEQEETLPCSIGVVWGSARLEGACPPPSAPIPPPPPAPPAVEPASSGAGGGGGAARGGGAAHHPPSAPAAPQRSTQAQERGVQGVSDAALLATQCGGLVQALAGQCGDLVQALAGQCDGLVQALRDINQSIMNLTQSVDRVCGQLQTRDAEQKNPSE